MTLELSDGQADLLYNTLMALCLQYEEIIEKADTASTHHIRLIQKADGCGGRA